jgi:rhomboid protease GluP
MAEPNHALRETILRQIQEIAPLPWYPREYAAKAEIPRESLNAPLNDLRVEHLIHLTEWQSGIGQGYLLTDIGREVLANPLILEQFRKGKPAVPPGQDPSAAATGTASTSAGPNRFERGEMARKAFYFGDRPVVIPILIFVNALVFLVTMAVAVRNGTPFLDFLNRGDQNTLHQFGAMTTTDIAKGQWWRLVSCCFIHFGLMHLCFNMLSLYLSRRIESMWGPMRFTILYFISGLCGSAAAVYYHPGTLDQTVMLAGASGALWGIMGSLFGWLIMNRSHLPARDARPILQQLLFSFIINSGISMLPGVSVAAHFGGGLAGIFLAVLMHMHRVSEPSKRTFIGLQIAFLPTLVLLGLATAFENSPRLQPFMEREKTIKERPQVLEYRQKLMPPIKEMLKALDDVDTRIDRLYNQAAAERKGDDVTAARSDLDRLIESVAGRIKELGDEKLPVDSAKSTRDEAVNLLNAMKETADALKARVAWEKTPTLTGLRRKVSELRVGWE